MFIVVGKYQKTNSTDYVIERAEDKSEIVIDQIHEMQKAANLSHAEMVVIINEAQHLNVSAQNALLKTLEEPPPNTVIKLYVDSEENLLPTIISRCVVIKEERQPPASEPNHKLISMINENNLKEGFAWAEKVKDRREAIQIITDLMTTMESLPIYAKLQKAKKYLSANCNVRLTLENLFIDTR